MTMVSRRARRTGGPSVFRVTVRGAEAVRGTQRGSGQGAQEPQQLGAVGGDQLGDAPADRERARDHPPVGPGAGRARDHRTDARFGERAVDGGVQEVDGGALEDLRQCGAHRVARRDPAGRCATVDDRCQVIAPVWSTLSWSRARGPPRSA